MIDPSSDRQTETARPAIVHGRWTGYRRLLVARLKELFREPEGDLLDFPVSHPARSRAGNCVPQQTA